VQDGTKENHAMKTKREIKAALDLAEGQRDVAPQDTINRLRYCFPDLAESDLLAMALRHPAAKTERRRWRRRIRAHRLALARLEIRGTRRL
jgi:hypothetical protein